ncbi:hypothetical protein AB0E11_18195 [Streptomyces fradiae]
MLNEMSGRWRIVSIVIGALLGTGLLAGLALWVYGVYTMSEPSNPIWVGIRIDDSRVTVKVPTCPSDSVGEVEVFDGNSEKPLWRARGPKYPAVKRGTVTLWANEEFQTAGTGPQPTPLPSALDVLVTYAGSEDGSGDNFDLSRALADKVPDGHYWTYDGPMTAKEIDAQLNCGGAELRSS